MPTSGLPLAVLRHHAHGDHHLLAGDEGFDLQVHTQPAGVVVVVGDVAGLFALIR
jgi:hypothetical protein